MINGTQTNEELLTNLKSTTEELVSRLKNYELFSSDAMSGETTDEGIALAAKALRVMYDGIWRVRGAQTALERAND